MSDENISTASDAGKQSEFSVTIPDAVPAPKADGATDEGGDKGKSNPADKVGSSQQGNDKPDEGVFKSRLDRMRRREAEKYADRFASQEKRIAELEAKLAEKERSKELNRDDFKTSQEYSEALRKKASDEVYDDVKARLNKEQEDARNAEEESAKYFGRFKQQFNSQLTPEMKAKVGAIISNKESGVMSALSSQEGETLNEWIFNEADNGPAVMLWLEGNPDKMERLLANSPRRQQIILDDLDRKITALVRSKFQAKDAPKDKPEETKDKPVVMGNFGGSATAIADESKLSDRERVAKLIKAMRNR